jgi:hypothetical protein
MLPSFSPRSSYAACSMLLCSSTADIVSWFVSLELRRCSFLMLTTASGQRALVPGGGGGRGDGEGGGTDGVDVGHGRGEHEDEAESEGDAMSTRMEPVSSKQLLGCSQLPTRVARDLHAASGARCLLQVLQCARRFIYESPNLVYIRIWDKNGPSGQEKNILVVCFCRMT